MPRKKPNGSRRLKARDQFGREKRLVASASDSRAIRMCGAKRGYNKAQARSAAARMTKLDGKPNYPYKCSLCGEWHVGHRPPDVDERVYDKNGSRTL